MLHLLVSYHLKWESGLSNKCLALSGTVILKLGNIINEYDACLHKVSTSNSGCKDSVFNALFLVVDIPNRCSLYIAT